MWAYVADYIRIKVLYENGGIYLDTDVTVLKSFDAFLDYPAFVGMQDNAIEGKDDYVEPAILGSQKNNLFFKQILEIYQKEIWNISIYTMPDLFQYSIQKMYPTLLQNFLERNKQKTITYPDIHILPERFFIPFRINEEYHPKCITPDTHTIHWWGGSWVKPEIVTFLKNKHKYPLDVLEKKSYLSIKCKFLNITILKFNMLYDTFYLWKIPIFKISRKKIKLKKYTQIFSLTLFGFIPIWKIQQKNGSFTFLYRFLNILTFKKSIK